MCGRHLNQLYVVKVELLQTGRNHVHTYIKILASFPGLRPSFCRFQYAIFFTQCQKKAVEWSLGMRLTYISFSNFQVRKLCCFFSASSSSS